MMEAQRKTHCWRQKRCHLTVEGAERHRANMLAYHAAMGHTRPGWVLRIYFCDPCRAYHIGHKRTSFPQPEGTAP